MLKTITILLVSTAATYAQADAPVPEFEPAPILKASEILKPEIAAGPNHRVMEQVVPSLGRNFYTIETPWGYFSADGDAMLMARVAEANALAELQNVSRTDEYKEGLKAAAKTPFNAVRGLVEDPKNAVKGTAKGIWKFMNRAGEGVKNVAEGRERGQGEEGMGKELLGFSKAKRELALDLGADPYSSNEVFQHMLEQVAWTKTAGAATFKLATLPIGGGAGMALTATGLTQNFQRSLRDLAPADLRLASKKKLIDMGVSPRMADDFLANPAFSPTHQTAFVTALDAMTGVKNRVEFVKMAMETATEEGDALFCSGTAQLLAALHNNKNPLTRIANIGGFPVAVAEDGRLVIALQWDTAFWSPRAAQFVEKAAAAKLGKPVIALTGNATPRAKAELEKRGIGLLTNALGGPQK